MVIRKHYDSFYSSDREIMWFCALVSNDFSHLNKSAAKKATNFSSEKIKKKMALGRQSVIYLKSFV